MSSIFVSLAKVLSINLLKEIALYFSDIVFVFNLIGLALYFSDILCFCFQFNWFLLFISFSLLLWVYFDPLFLG